MKQTNKTALIGFVIGLFVGIAGTRLAYLEPSVPIVDEEKAVENDAVELVEEVPVSVSENVPESDVTLDDIGSVTVSAESNFIEVKDQTAGESVFVTRAGLTQNGWVVVHEVLNGDFGNILGAKRFDAGIHQDTISLLRATAAGNMYRAVLYVDDGDKVFDFSKDVMAAGTSGLPIFMSFEAY